MPDNSVSNLKFAIVLFIDIIAYSKLLITEQRELLRKLTELVRQADDNPRFLQLTAKPRYCERIQECPPHVVPDAGGTGHKEMISITS